eukprot:TRINITY_DN23988_c0_g1_i8.p3 TRINITY_DN23988_c0_g1~~TRINITY_DN23988_c0_g1_i8.p3  ORF type:complete len:121 (-),score=16.51 TRINITY_DN23988_c0_g1_i8:209-571(-)
MGDSGESRIIMIKSMADWKAQLESAKNSSQVIIVDFTAKWCGPCNIIAPKFEEFSKQFTDVIFLKVDVDEVAEVASECGISAMPTFQVHSDGVKVDELVGASTERLQALIQKYSKVQQAA